MAQEADVVKQKAICDKGNLNLEHSLDTTGGQVF